jgi:hypothetical protein
MYSCSEQATSHNHRSIALHAAEVTLVYRTPLHSSIVQTVPGPGQYNIPSMFQFGPAYTMAKRTPRKDVKEDVPGVGTYDCVPANQGTGPAFTVATRPPAFSRTDDVPGPGAYYAPEKDRYATTI